MRQVIGLVLIGAALSIVNAQEAQKPELGIKISAPAEVKAGSDVYITIVMTNFSDHPVDCSAWYVNGTDRRFRVDVRDSHGNSMKRPDVHPEMMPGSLQGLGSTLQPGESTGPLQDRISWANDLSQPGVYTVQVSRVVANDEKNGLVKSNTISLTIAP